MSEANIESVRRGYAALNQGDLWVVLDLLDPDIEWHEPAPSPDAGTHQGRESFERFLRGWLESFDEFRVEPQRIIEQDDRLIAVVRQTGKGRASGLEIEATLAHVWTVADGRAIRWEAVGEPEEALGDRA
jgi:ketosteroid isomerase-like protein